MISNTPPIKMGFIKSYKSSCTTFSIAFKKFRQDLPLLWKNNTGIFMIIFIPLCIWSFISPLSEKSELLVYAALLLPTLILPLPAFLMLTVRIMEANLSTEGYQIVGWRGIKWGKSETKLVGCSLLMILLIVLGVSIYGGCAYLLYKFIHAVLSTFLENSTSSPTLESNCFLFVGVSLILGGLVTLVHLGSRLVFYSVFAAANIRRSLKESILLTKNKKVYSFFFVLISHILLLLPAKLFNVIENLLAGHSFFIRGGVSSVIMILELLIVILSVYFEVEAFKQIASPDLKKRLSEAFLAKKS